MGTVTAKGACGGTRGGVGNLDRVEGRGARHRGQKTRDSHSSSSANRSRTAERVCGQSEGRAYADCTHHNLSDFALRDVAELNLLDCDRLARGPVQGT